MELSDYRQQIDGIDSQLLALFYQRMEVAAQIAGYKKARNLPALDAGRERAKLQQIADAAPEDLREYAVSLYSLIFELSRSCQNRLLGVTSPLTARDRAGHRAHTATVPGAPGRRVSGRGGRVFPARVRPPVHDAERVLLRHVRGGVCRHRKGPVPLRRHPAGKQHGRLRQRRVRPDDAAQLPHRAQRAPEDRPLPAGQARHKALGHQGDLTRTSRPSASAAASCRACRA